MRFTRVLAVAGAILLASGAGLLSAESASAHTGSLNASAACNDNGTYTITYTGVTTNVPSNGSGHSATLTVTEIQPAGTSVTPPSQQVVGNTAYLFTQTVPGGSKYAQATASLNWGDAAKSDPQGRVTLSGNCTASAPKSYQTVVWQMQTKPASPDTATWPQTLVSHAPHASETLEAQVPTTCGTYYQVDSYYDSATTATLIAGKHLDGPGNPAEDLAPGGLGTAWRFVINPDCVPDASAAVTVHAPTCTSPASLALTGENVTWNGTANGATGPGAYDATATAQQGHTFSDGKTSREFTGALAGPAGYQHNNADQPCYQALKDAAAAQVVTAATCTSAASLSVTGSNVTWTGTADGTKGPGKYDAIATAKPGHEFANGKTSQDFTGDLAAATGHQHTDAQAPCYTAPAATVTTASNKTALAETGSDVTMGLVAGIGVLVGGAALAGFSVIRRRRSNA